MFQGEARFGRMVRIRRCWAEKPQRRTVCNGDEREFLAQLGAAHPSEFIIMVVDGASSHVAKGSAEPQNIRLLRLPPCAPELNPQEHVWGEWREKEFPQPRVCRRRQRSTAT